MEDRFGWNPGKDGVRAELNILYSAGDSVRQALAAETANQLEALGIETSIEGVGWDTAYDRAQMEPLMWGWGAHTPMELYNIYHRAPGSEYAQYSPYETTRWTSTWTRPWLRPIWMSPMSSGKWPSSM